ncbi:UTP--glucose-1-phosphate uridylyltransferase [bacterium]|nr:UTP--glucose-1-phosphate uridylyltransferase [bacterium]
MNIVKKAVIPAAGLGTRFLPVTKSIPKEMLAIIDKPTIQYVVEEAVESGITDILIIVGKNKNSIKNYFSKSEMYDALTNRTNLQSVDELMSKAKFSFVLQEELRGNGHAVMLARDFVAGEPFAVLFGDDIIYNPEYPCTKQLMDAFATSGKTILGAQNRPDAEAVNYGVIQKGKETGRLTEIVRIVEKPAIDSLPSNLCSLGRFVLPPSIFDALDRTPLYKNEIYLSLAIDLLIKEEGVFAYEFEGLRYDIGDKFGFLQANIEYALRSAPYKDTLAKYLKQIAQKL